MRAGKRVIYNDDIDTDELADWADGYIDFLNENGLLPKHVNQEEYISTNEASFYEYIADQKAICWDEDCSEMMRLFEREDVAGYLAKGHVQRWDGTREGFYVTEDFTDLVSTSGMLRDCGYMQVWDENGHLFIRGIHHDGDVAHEVRLLSEDGMEAFMSANVRSMDVWNDPEGKYGTQIPRIMERCWGCKPIEFENIETCNSMAHVITGLGETIPDLPEIVNRLVNGEPEVRIYEESDPYGMEIDPETAIKEGFWIRESDVPRLYEVAEEIICKVPMKPNAKSVRKAAQREAEKSNHETTGYTRVRTQ